MGQNGITSDKGENMSGSMRTAALTTLTTAGLALAGVTSSAEAVSAAAPPALPAAGSWAVGWSAATLKAPTGAAVVLVAPNGQQRALGTAPAGSTVQDVSHDGRRVLTQTVLSETAHRYFMWDAATNRKYQITLDNHGALFFGTSGVLVSHDEGRRRVVLRTIAGTPTKVLPGLFGDSPYVSPGGSQLSYYSSGTGTIDIASLSTGKVVRKVRQPQQVSCGPSGMWSNGHLKFWCTDIPGTSNTYTANPSTGAVTRRGSAQEDLGQVVPTAPLVGTAYWWERKLLDVSGSRARTIALNGPWGSTYNGVDLLAGRSTSAWATVTWGPDTPQPSKRTLVRHDLSTGRTTTLAGTGSTDGRFLISAQTVDALT